MDPLGPRSCYEEGKSFGEALCKAYRDEYGIDVRIGRIWICLGILGSRGRAFGEFPVIELTWQTGFQGLPMHK